MPNLTLQPRLRLLATLVPEGARLADVGTDHGYLPVFLLQTGKILSAVASDIRPEPLEHAKRTAAEYGIDGISFRLCAGLDAVAPDEADVIAIAGMGGEVIADILSRAPWTRDGAHTMLLQPMTKAAFLRSWLAENGYCIAQENLVRDKGRLYAVITARAGQSGILTAVEAAAGVRLGGDPLYGDYLEELIRKQKRAAAGLRRAANKEQTQQLAETEALLAALLKRKEVWELANRERN